MGGRTKEEVLTEVEGRITEFERWLLAQADGQAPTFDDFGDPTGEVEPIPLARPEKQILRTFLLWANYYEHPDTTGSGAEERKTDG